MAKVVPFQHPMRADVFESNVRDRAVFSHMVIRTDHINEQMLERGISIRQVLNALRKGSIAGDPTRNEAKSSYEGEIKYHGTGREITVICAIRQSELTVIGITVY